MIDWRAVGCVVFGLIAVQYVGWWSFDPFDALAEHGTETAYVRLENLTGSEVTRAKLNHIEHAPAYDVVLFGNSGTLGVTQDDLLPKGGRFFNASVGGMSFRHSVEMLEGLARHGRLPKTVLMVFDHAEIQYIANQRMPSLRDRWRANLRDVAFAVGSGQVPLRDGLRMVHRVVRDEWQEFQYRMAARVAWRTWTWGWRGGVADLVSPDKGFATDGHIERETLDLAPGARIAIERGGDGVLLPYLRHDLARLAALDTKVVVFEGLLAPNIVREIGDTPMPHAEKTRTTFLESCGRLGLACYPAPTDPNALGDIARWGDAIHPPHDIIGPYLRALLEREHGQG